MIVDEMPCLEVRSIIWDTLKITGASRRWLRVVDHIETGLYPKAIKIICGVCRELNRSANPLDLSQVKFLSDLSYQEVVLKKVRIALGSKVTGSQVYTYWGGRCDKCEVMYWAMEPGPAPTVFTNLPKG